jgi:hypothetical protein
MPVMIQLEVELQVRVTGSRTNQQAGTKEPHRWHHHHHVYHPRPSQAGMIMTPSRILKFQLEVTVTGNLNNHNNLNAALAVPVPVPVVRPGRARDRLQVLPGRLGVGMLVLTCQGLTSRRKGLQVGSHDSSSTRLLIMIGFEPSR